MSCVFACPRSLFGERRDQETRAEREAPIRLIAFPNQL
jgi:hypothetical protein